jgi:threonyl-tRNA synthetase
MSSHTENWTSNLLGMSDAQITVKLPDGSAKEIPAGSTAGDLATTIGRRLAEAAVVAEIDGLPRDLTTTLQDGQSVRFITEDTDEGRFVIRHSTAHVLAQAVIDLWPGTNIAIGPPIENGFYYDMMLAGGASLSEDDLGKIDARMREIVAADQAFERRVVGVDEALTLLKDNPYKVEIINNHETAQGVEEGRVSLYANPPGPFCDLCRGPHVMSTGRLKHFKLQKVAGAYWRGDEKRDMLQRVYGTAWESKKKLDEYLTMLEEAEKRDHRKLGLELDLFSFPEELGSGLPVFHPKGGLIRKIMEDYSRKRHEEAGYSFVNTPHITKSNLYEKSGHLDWYADGMFPPMTVDEDHKYYVKPMNCPMHILIYQSRQRSYRDLPIRMFEFGSVYRYEKSGVIHGLTRVRGMTQDDAHIFTTREDMKVEIKSVLEFVLNLLADYGLDDYYLELSTKPETKFVGSDEDWTTATDTLRQVAEESGLDLVMDEGGGAFYGPKISVQARDAIGRTWQMSTVQLDFQLPERFGMEYTGADNAKHRPIMVHRALFGSVERFMGVLVEHYAGAFPLWLSPEQVRILPVKADVEEYAKNVEQKLKQAGYRVGYEEANEPLGNRIRKAKLEKLPYVLVVGDDDVANGTLGVNPRGGEVERGVSVDEFLIRLEVENVV